VRVRAFVLAAGFGTRLRPLTEELPKPAWPFFDVPLAAHVLLRLAQAGIADVIVNLHHLGARLQEALKPWVPDGMRIHWSPEEHILGTGGALDPWKEVLAGGPFFLLNADTYQELDFGAMARYHRDRQAAATLAVRRLAPGSKAPIEVGGEGRIVRFLSRQVPGASPGSPCEFTGVHLLEPGVLAALPGGPCCINADVHAGRVGQGMPYFGFDPGDGSFWSDLGTPEGYLDAHRHFLREGRLPPGSPGLVVRGGAIAEGGGEVIGPAYVGPGARVEAGSVAGPYAVLGRGSVVGRGARVEESVLWPGASLTGGSIRRSIVSPSGLRLRASP
jgi:NDP-sugar pyrophosphorylase family protein